MKELTELIYNIDENRKFMVVFSQPRKWWYCCRCESDKAYAETPPPKAAVRKVSLTFWKNFEYSLKYPEKEKYEEKVVPIITSWNIAAKGGHLVVCDNPSWSHVGPWDAHVFFWQDSGKGSNYLEIYTSDELFHFLPKIKTDIEKLIKDVPDFEEKEVSR